MQSYRRPLLHLTIAGHMPLVDLYLLFHAIADRLGLTDLGRCPYCNAPTLCRWPWQGWEDVADCDGGAAEVAAKRAARALDA